MRKFYDEFLQIHWIWLSLLLPNSVKIFFFYAFIYQDINIFMYLFFFLFFIELVTVIL